MNELLFVDTEIYFRIKVVLHLEIIIRVVRPTSWLVGKGTYHQD